MTSSFDGFIQVNRTFHELSQEQVAGGEVGLTRSFSRRDPLRWTDLLSEYRVILLSEAGSGKTAEIRNVARELRIQGNRAFFVRIEHVCHELEDAFEEGSFEEFNEWIASGETGWMLLDSVDEARLRDPKDFERAVRKLGRLLAPVLQQAHIVVTGRTTAWRATTDLLLCRNALPYRPAEQIAYEDAPIDETRHSVREQTNVLRYFAPFKIVALDDLHGPQVDAFLRGKQVQDLRAFREGVDRNEVLSLTTRPQDLAELVGFWNEHHRIGSRLELMNRSIERRLMERDQDRSEAYPIAVEKLRQGARLVAAASTLAKRSEIRVPDGENNGKGIPIREVLTDWNDAECLTLLSRPIFDESIYGTVRFHHRSVREYLTAEWLHGLIVDKASRSRIESLFFRSQYGVEVVVPTMRPVLPWLVILDEQILARVCRLAPEILFEGGDPSQLPLDTRKDILRQACEQLAQPAHGRSFMDYAAVQRFANADLSDEVKTLLVKYGDDDDIVCFLLRIVCQGRIEGLAAEAQHFALTSREKYTRIAAIRALAAVGTETDQDEVRRAFLDEDNELSREWLAELIPNLPANGESVEWLLTALSRSSEKERFATDHLLNALLRLITDWPLTLLPVLNAGLQGLLALPPFIDRRYCELSERYSWLAQAAAQSMLRLIEARDLRSLELSSLSILRIISSTRAYGKLDSPDVAEALSKAIREWGELNNALFWHDVSEARASLGTNVGERLVSYWQASTLSPFWVFEADSFVAVCEDVARRKNLDDRLVALTLAFSIYRANGCSDARLKELVRVASAEPELASTLEALLNPPLPEKQTWQKEQERWAKRAERRTARSEEQKRKWKDHLEANAALLRNPVEPNSVTNNHVYLQDRMRDVSEQTSKWSEGDWHSLIPEFGEPIARAFRDGAVRFWRNYQPQLLSEGAPANTTPFKVIFGLTGLAIEAREVSDWPATLSGAEAAVATRYALLELNGFPSWLPSLYAAYPDEVIGVALGEVDYELGSESPERESHYVLSDISSSGNWMWNRLAKTFLARLRKPPKSVRYLRYLLNIVQESALDNSSIAKIASQKAKVTKNTKSAPIWFAVWVGVDPAVAIPALTARLAEIKEDSEKTLFAMRFITELTGGRYVSRGVRNAYRTVQYVKTLYLLVHHYVRRSEDINRAGGGDLPGFLRPFGSSNNGSG